jgi:septum formation protein
MDIKIRLASGSPRRLELIALTGWAIEAIPADIGEQHVPGEAPAAMTRRLAQEKAQALADRAELVLGADTVVIDGDRTLGKPTGVEDARRTLMRLRGRTHQVITSIAILKPEDGIQLDDRCLSAVPMRDYSDAEIERYLASESPLDKAGSYGIQDGGFRPVEMTAMRDCYANVMGLPLCHVARNLRKLGHEPPADVPTACQHHTGYECHVYPQILEGPPNARTDSKDRVQ